MPVWTGSEPPYVDEELSSENPQVKSAEIQEEAAGDETVENDINNIIFHKNKIEEG